MKKICFFEPCFFLFFGIFHIHRIWGLLDREGYSAFWLKTMEDKGVLYFTLMIVLAGLCLIGIFTFFKEMKKNYWWRLIYICGGVYLLFDLFAIAAGLGYWHDLLLMMFDTSSPYWNFIWGGFILLGCLVFLLGISLLIKQIKQKD